MLQVITGMYFRDVALYETEHRRTLYTNLWGPWTCDRIDLGIGHLIPTTDHTARVSTMLVCVTERLEAVRDDGTDEFLRSTGGSAIIDDLATVLSFALGATVTTNHDTAERLIGPPSGTYRTPVTPADILPGVFTPGRYLTEEQIADLQQFLSTVLGLRRESYTAALAAMRRIVTASQRVAEDPTLSYTDYVAALESLSAETDAARTNWQRLDSRKRKILDPALSALDDDTATPIREAILEAERAGIRSRYSEFVLTHVRPSFYREEATTVTAPVRAAALPRLVSAAYTARSKNLHELRHLDPRAWPLVGDAEVLDPVSGDPMLTHRGLDRLARHVVRTFVDRAPTGRDEDFRWREHLPNLVHARLAPEYYLGHAEAMAAEVAATRAGEYIAHLIEALSGRAEQYIDMRPALQRIETIVPDTRKSDVRLPLLTIYYLWHMVTHSDMHCPAPEKLLTIAVDELRGPNIYSFAISMLLAKTPDWTTAQLQQLADARMTELQRRKPLELHPRLDAALWVRAAHAHQLDGEHAAALTAIEHAIGCRPGDQALLDLERTVIATEPIDIDLRAYVLGPRPPEQEAPAPAPSQPEPVTVAAAPDPAHPQPSAPLPQSPAAVVAIQDEPKGTSRPDPDSSQS